MIDATRLDIKNRRFSFLYPKSIMIVLRPYMLWNTKRMRIRTSRTGCLWRLSAQSGFLSFVNKKKLVSIFMPNKTIRQTPLILWKSQINMLCGNFYQQYMFFVKQNNKKSQKVLKCVWCYANISTTSKMIKTI